VQALHHDTMHILLESRVRQDRTRFRYVYTLITIPHALTIIGHHSINTSNHITSHQASEDRRDQHALPFSSGLVRMVRVHSATEADTGHKTLL